MITKKSRCFEGKVYEAFACHFHSLYFSFFFGDAANGIEEKNTQQFVPEAFFSCIFDANNRFRTFVLGFGVDVMQMATVSGITIVQQLCRD